MRMPMQKKRDAICVVARVNDSSSASRHLYTGKPAMSE